MHDARTRNETSRIEIQSFVTRKINKMCLLDSCIWIKLYEISRRILVKSERTIRSCFPVPERVSGTKVLPVHRSWATSIGKMPR